jgi:hypothetical protein
MICERVGFDTFERGPVGVAFAFHDNLDPPEACFGTAATFARALHMSYWTDAELAAAIANRTGMPASYAEVSLEETSSSTRVWRIEGPDVGTNTFEWPVADTLTAEVPTETTRMAWAHDVGVRGFDYTDSWTGADSEVPLARTEMDSSFPFARHAVPAPVALAETYLELQYATVLFGYLDGSCNVADPDI